MSMSLEQAIAALDAEDFFLDSLLYTIHKNLKTDSDRRWFARTLCDHLTDAQVAQEVAFRLNPAQPDPFAP